MCVIDWGWFCVAFMKMAISTRPSHRNYQQREASVSTILKHELPNGLVVLAEPNDRLESVAFTFLVPAGSAYDPLPRSGLSSLTCEMALRGAGQRGSRDFVRDLDNLGLERSEGVTASHTSFGGATLSRNLLPSLRIYADLLRSAHLPDDQLEAGRMVALQDLSALEDDPGQQVMLHLRRLRFPGPWGRASQGEASSLAAISSQDIKRFYNDVYRPMELFCPWRATWTGNRSWTFLKNCFLTGVPHR